MFRSLFSRLSLVFLIMLALLGAGLLFLSQKVSDRFSQEVMQHLNQEVAMYITQQEPLLNNQQQINASVLDRLAHHAMVLNPTVEIYVLDAEGNILGHRLPPASVLLSVVDLQPIKRYLDAGKFPIVGDDPRQPHKPKVFSVAPIVQQDQTLGYVYVILGGQLYQQIRESAFGSYSLQMGIALTLVSVIAASMLGCFLFFVMTRRLSELRRQVTTFNLRYPDSQAINVFRHHQPNGATQGVDEIDQLASSFQQMASHICDQFEALKNLDENRRELIANVSHDLRTPLASMQGYIETVLIKYRELSEQDREDYLRVAIRHCQRLAGLIDQLFELSRLESNNLQPHQEPFSLLELAHDCVQEFSLKAQEKGIYLRIEHDNMDGYVVADIGMIQRVLQNLIDNALIHTPTKGEVIVAVKQAKQGYCLEVRDSGSGIDSHEIPHIFDRYYRAQQTQESDKIGTGLGLAIVKRILELHQCQIRVDSETQCGTCFSFVLPSSIPVT